MSSMVASPAVLPYSSITMAMCAPSSCISRSRSFTGLVSGTKRMGRVSSFTRRPWRSASSSSNMSRTCTKPMMLIDGVLVHRNARILLVDHQLAQVLERPVGFDGDDLGPRRHHFAHRLVAESDHGLDQLAVVLLDDAFFFAGRDQRFDVARRAGSFFVRVGGLGEIDQRLEESENRGQRPHQQRAQAQQRAPAAAASGRWFCDTAPAPEHRWKPAW